MDTIHVVVYSVGVAVAFGVILYLFSVIRGVISEGKEEDFYTPLDQLSSKSYKDRIDEGVERAEIRLLLSISRGNAEEIESEAENVESMLTLERRYREISKEGNLLDLIDSILGDMSEEG